MNYSAHLNQFNNCYACTHMPTTAGNAALWPYSTNRKRTKCVMELATHPGDHSDAHADYSVPLNFSRYLARNHVCSSFSDLLAWPQMPVALPQIIITHHLEENYFPYCVLGEGDEPVGRLAPTLCNLTLTHCTPRKKSMCEKCRNDPICKKAPIKNSICETNLTSIQ